MFIKDRQDIYT